MRNLGDVSNVLSVSLFSAWGESPRRARRAPGAMRTSFSPFLDAAAADYLLLILLLLLLLLRCREILESKPKSS